MSDELDRLLDAAGLEPPDDFAGRVMRRLARERVEPRVPRRAPGWAQWLALAGGALLGGAQLAGFVFGLWAAGTAG